MTIAFTAPRARPHRAGTGMRTAHAHARDAPPTPALTHSRLPSPSDAFPRPHAPAPRPQAELMKISRQKDKKIRLMDWVAEHTKYKPAPKPAASPVPKLDVARSRGPADAGVGDLIGHSPRRAAPEPPTAPSAPAEPARPLTARADFAAPGASSKPVANSPPPAPPLTARAAPAVADMSAAMATFVEGKDHLQMSGGECHDHMDPDPNSLRQNGPGQCA